MKCITKELQGEFKRNNKKIIAVPQEQVSKLDEEEKLFNVIKNNFQGSRIQEGWRLPLKVN